MSFHGILIGATGSGSGKTIISLCIASVLKKRGYRIQPFKVGPDFIDPTHYAHSLGVPAVNLDVFMMGENEVKKSFARWTRKADFAFVEGVMGLYDGYKGSDIASSAHIAKILGLPVVLIIDVRGMSRSAAAVIRGFRDYDPEIQFRGVILNNVGGKSHKAMVENSLQEIGIELLGAFPKLKEFSMESRHLGLKMGFEEKKNWKKLAEIGERYLDVERIVEISEVSEAEVWSDNGDSEDGLKNKKDENKVRIGVPFDEAFCFYYLDNIEYLKRYADVKFFSPLQGEFTECDGYYIGGGYPELYAEQLEKSKSTEKIRKEAEEEKPIYGECGGFMYLSRILTVGKKKYKMCGVLDVDIVQTDKLQALGYVKGKAVTSNPVFLDGFKGHEFHYSVAYPDRDVKYAFRVTGKGICEGYDGQMAHSTVGGYTHVHFSSTSLEHFITNCRRKSE
jgi:cobyrinic acid a,c-diamide synthase